MLLSDYLNPIKNIVEIKWNSLPQMRLHVDYIKKIIITVTRAYLRQSSLDNKLQGCNKGAWDDDVHAEEKMSRTA